MKQKYSSLGFWAKSFHGSRGRPLQKNFFIAQSESKDVATLKDSSLGSTGVLILFLSSEFFIRVKCMYREALQRETHIPFVIKSFKKTKIKTKKSVAPNMNYFRVERRGNLFFKMLRKGS